MPDSEAESRVILDRDGIAEAVVAEQLGLLTRKRVDLPINLVNAILVVAALWRLYPRWAVVLWLGLFCSVLLVRYLVRRRYGRLVPGTVDTRRWGRIFALNAFATACLWGATGTVILVTPNPVYHLFIVFLLGGTMAGGIVSNSAYMPAMLAFMLPTISPLIAALLSRHTITEVEMGVLLTIFSGLLISVGFEINHSIIENFRLRISQSASLTSLRASEAALAEAQEISHTGSWEQDLRTGNIALSQEMFRILGTDRATFQPTFEAILARVHPHDRPMVEKDYAKVLASGTGSGLDHRIVTDAGAVRFVHEIVRTTYDTGGRPLRINGIVQDITERKQGEVARSLLAAIVDASLDAIVGEDILGTITSWNPGAERLFGYRADEMVGNSVRMIIPADRRPEIDRNLLKLASGEPIEPFDTVRLKKDGTLVPVSVAVSLIRDGAGGLAGASFISRDITERVHNAAALAYRDLLLHAVTSGTAILVKAISLEEGMPAALQAVGESMRADRVLVMQDCSGDSPAVAIRHVWQAPGITIPAELSATLAETMLPEEMAAWRSPLKDGKPVIAHVTASEGSVRTMLDHFHIKSTLMVPIFVDGKLWGDLGADSCAVERQWEPVEIDVLRTFADIAGSLIARTETQRSLELANILLKTQMEASPDGILVVDTKQAIISFNQRFADIWAIPQLDLVAGKDEPVLARVMASVKDPRKFQTRVQYLYNHPGEAGQEDIEMIDGRVIDRHTIALVMPDGKILGRVWFFRDITARKQAEAHAIRLARYDELTGLPNRSVFVESLQRAIAKRSEKSFAVIYLDLDHFKDVNDTLGHPVGDSLLQEVANRLRSNTRESDTVARFGGDEFAVIVADVEEAADAALLASKLIAALGRPYSIQGNEIYSGASIGIDLYGPEASDAETLLSHADVALYRAKGEGRGGYRFFTDAMDKEVRLQVSLGTELHEAISSGQFFLLYQPQVKTATGRMIGVEALVRWRHPVRGVLGPELFIPAAEKTGIIVNLGHWVLLTACREAKAWLDSGFEPIRTGVNLSALQFKSPIMLETDIAAVLAETGLPPHLLELELTETILMDASRAHRDIIERLRRIGVTIAIDDFGTGYSSLDYLRRFPSDRIKIAQTFVGHLETMPGDAAIVKATIGLARELGIMVIAEGVETREQFELLKSWGCGEVQGFYFAEPLTPEEITLLLAKGGILKPTEIPKTSNTTLVI